MTPKRKPLSGLARLLKSHLRLLRVHRGQIRELGELRKAILDMRQSVSILRRMAQETRELMKPQSENQPPKRGITSQEWMQATCSTTGMVSSDYMLNFLRDHGHLAEEPPKEFDVPPNDWPRL